MTLDLRISGLDFERSAQSLADANGIEFAPCCTAAYSQPITEEYLTWVRKPWLERMRGGEAYDGPMVWDNESSKLDALQTPGSQTTAMDYFRRTMQVANHINPAAKHLDYGITSRNGHWSGVGVDRTGANEADAQLVIAGMMRGLVTSAYYGGTCQPIYQGRVDKDGNPLVFDRPGQHPWNQAKAALSCMAIAAPPKLAYIMFSGHATGHFGKGRLTPEQMLAALMNAIGTQEVFPTDAQGMGTKVAGIIAWQADLEQGMSVAAARETHQREMIEAMIEARRLAA